MLRARRSNEPDALICFNLLPQETADEAPSVPGRVSETRLLLVEYWRRDQRAAALEASRAASSVYDGDLPASKMFVNGAPVSPQLTETPPPTAPAPPPLPVQEAAPPPAPERPAAAAQAPALDPNRIDFLSSLKSKARPSPAPAASSATGPLIIELPSSSEPGAAPQEPAPPAAASLFTQDAPAAPPPVERPRSVFEPRAREVAPSQPAAASVFAKAVGEIPPLNVEVEMPAVEFLKDEPAPQVNTARQAKVDALQAFLARVERRRQQIESQSVA